MSSAASESPTARLSCDPAGCRWFDGEEPAVDLGQIAYSDESGSPVQLPSLPAAARAIAWPVESLLVRPFQLPLNNPKLLDADMLAQELVDMSGAEPGEWWLAWQGAQTESGVRGLVFGLPETLRSAMRSDPCWQKTPSLRVDAWERLSRWLPGEAQQQVIAVIDQDRQGVFFGLYGEGTWLGMRRLNWQPGNVRRSDTSVQGEIIASLRSMAGDATWDTTLGLLAESFQRSWGELADHWQGIVVGDDALPERHTANLAALSDDQLRQVGLDFRYGRWSSSSAWPALRIWKRTAKVAAACLLIWLLGSGVQIARLSAQINGSEKQILAAFHAGLPKETVIIDPLAQLRRASGATGGAADTGTILRQLDSLTEVYRKQPWEIAELSFADDHAQMQGTTPNIQTLNTIRAGLQASLSQDVQILDTDLAGDQVNFRMRW